MQSRKLFQSNLRTSANSFCEDQPRQPPEKIRQDKYTKAYAKLTFIPEKTLQLNIEKIKYLYLSHNKIISLVGIEKYSSLISLNVSYNQLTNIQQLRDIQNPLKIRWLGLKMNKFLFGYQDWAIRWFQNLQKLDDTKLLNKQQKIKTLIKCQNIANYSLQFFYRVRRVLQFMEDFKNKLLLNRNSQRQSNLKLLYENIPQNFIFKISQIYQNPDTVEQSSIGHKKITQTIQLMIYNTLSLQIDLKCTCRPKGYKQQLEKSFSFIANKILIRFAKRSNKQLIRSIQILQKKSQYPLQIWQSFGHLPNFNSNSIGGNRYQNALYEPKGKHIIEQNQNENKLIMLNRSNFNSNENIKITITNPQDNKLSFLPKSLKYEKIDNKKVMGNNLDSKTKYNQKNSQFAVYERLPIFVYQKNYIECLFQVFMQMIKQILQKFDEIQHLAQSSYKQQETIKNRPGLSILIQKQKNDISIPVLQQVDQNQLKRVYSEVSFGIPSSPLNKQIFDSLQVQVQQKIGKVKFYSLHQINLIYKTFRGLKQNSLMKQPFQRRRQRSDENSLF